MELPFSRTGGKAGTGAESHPPLPPGGRAQKRRDEEPGEMPHCIFAKHFNAQLIL